MIRVAAFKFDDGRIEVVERLWFRSNLDDAEKAGFFSDHVAAMTVFDAVDLESARVEAPSAASRAPTRARVTTTSTTDSTKSAASTSTRVKPPAGRRRVMAVS